jgi:hypothetical protein
MEDSLWFRLDDGRGASEEEIATAIEPHSTWEDTPDAQQMSGPWNPLDLRVQQGLEPQMHSRIPGPSWPTLSYSSSYPSFHVSSETQTTLTSDHSILLPYDMSECDMTDSVMSIRPRLTPSNLAQLSSYRSDSVGSFPRNESPEHGDGPPNEVSVLSSVDPEIFFCPVVGCTKEFRGKCARGTRSRHLRLKHTYGQEENVYRCEVPGCSKVYCRQDARLKHYRKRHSDVMHVAAAKPRK